MEEIMADEKTETDEFKKPTELDATGAPVKTDASFVSPEHPPVSHIMPRIEVVENETIVVPPKPPTTNVMPPPPETKINLTVPPPPVYADLPQAQPRIPEAPHPTPPSKSAPEPTPVQPPAPPKAAPAHTQDSIADDVGLTIPAAHAKAPDPMQTDMNKILAGIKLPEKRDYTPSGEKKPAPSVAVQDQQKLDQVLSAHITENVIASQQPPAPPITQSMVPDQNVFHEEMHVASVHTLKQDLQQVVQEQKMSVVKAVALEQEKRQRQDRMMEQAPPRPPSRAPAVVLTTAVFLFLGVAALGSVYYIAMVQSAPGPAVENASLVFAEQTVAFPLRSESSQTLRAELAQARNAGGTLGSLLHIVPTVSAVDAAGTSIQRPATLSEFFASLAIEPPDNLMRALGDDFFLGIHTVDKNAPILVIKVASYDRAFDGMLSWEKNLNSDLAPLFTAVPRLVMGPDGLQIQRPYTDLVMRNYDVRALKDDDGVIQLYYSFPTRDLLIIAESPYTFTEILSRLQAGRRL